MQIGLRCAALPRCASVLRRTLRRSVSARASEVGLRARACSGTDPRSSVTTLQAQAGAASVGQNINAAGIGLFLQVLLGVRRATRLPLRSCYCNDRCR